MNNYQQNNYPPNYNPGNQQNNKQYNKQYNNQYNGQYNNNYNNSYNNSNRNDIFDGGRSGRSRGVAGILAILLGWVGVQYFYCGKITGGFIAILISLVTCGSASILWLIQGIIMLTLPTQEQFEQKYVCNDNVFPLF